MKTKYNLYRTDIERYCETLRVSGIKMVDDSAFNLIFEEIGSKGAFTLNFPFRGKLKFWEEGSGFLCAGADSLNLLKLPNLFK